jgi:predicted  nucleic acid-binding Zn-ribbon protein
MKRIFLIFLFLFSAQLSYAEVYKWVDEKGGVHFTDDLLQIPEKYRPKVEKLGPSEEQVETKMEGEPLAEKKNKKTPEDAYRDQLGRGEQYWKSRVEEWSKKLRDSQDRLNHLRVEYNELTERFNGSKSSVERINLRKERDQIKSEMDRFKNQIEEAKEMLEKKIPEEAEIFKAKQEWIKQ